MANNLMCPNCKSTDIFKPKVYKLDDKDNVICNACGYSQYVIRFRNTWRIEDKKKSDSLSKLND